RGGLLGTQSPSPPRPEVLRPPLGARVRVLTPRRPPLPSHHGGDRGLFRDLDTRRPTPSGPALARSIPYRCRRFEEEHDHDGPRSWGRPARVWGVGTRSARPAGTAPVRPRRGRGHP